MHLPFLPFEYIPIYLEADAFWLQNVQWFGCFTLLPFFTLFLCGSRDEVWEKVLRAKRRRNAGTLSILKLIPVQWRGLCRYWDVGIDTRKIYVYDFACIRVHCGDEVLFVLVNNVKADREEKGRYQWMCVEVFVLGEARKKQRLLKAKRHRKAVVVSNRPSISEDLVRLDACTSRKSVAVLVDGLDKTGFTNLLCESLHARVILHNILALEKFLGRYLGLSAFGELDNAFNTPSTFSAVKCHNCVVDITAVRVQGKRMQLSESVCHLPRNDVYELRKKKWWSVLIGEWFKSALDDRSTIKPTARSSRSVCPTAFLLPGEVITKEPKIQTTQWAGRARSEAEIHGTTSVRTARLLSTNTTHVNFGFAHYRYAIFVFHWLTSREWNAEVRENGALRWRKEVVCDESHSLDDGVRRKMVAH